MRLPPGNCVSLVQVIDKALGQRAHSAQCEPFYTLHEAAFKQICSVTASTGLISNVVTTENYHAANVQCIVAAKIGSMCTLRAMGEAWLAVLITENEASQPDEFSIDRKLTMTLTRS